MTGWYGDSQRHSFAARGVKTRNAISLYEKDGELVFLLPTHNQTYPIAKLEKDPTIRTIKNPDVILIPKNRIKPTSKLIRKVESGVFGFNKTGKYTWYNDKLDMELIIRPRKHGDIYSGRYILEKWSRRYGRELWGSNSRDDLYIYLYLWAYIYKLRSKRSYNDLMIDALNKMYKQGLIKVI